MERPRRWEYEVSLSMCEDRALPEDSVHQAIHSDDDDFDHFGDCRGGFPGPNDRHGRVNGSDPVENRLCRHRGASSTWC